MRVSAYKNISLTLLLRTDPAYPTAFGFKLNDMSLSSNARETVDLKELEKSGLSYQYRAEAGSSSAERSRACRRCGRGPGGIRNSGGLAAPTGTIICTTQNRGLIRGP